MEIKDQTTEDTLFANAISMEQLESRLELADTASRIHIEIEIDIEF